MCVPALSELVNELGLVGGPRVQRVDDKFRTLLGDVWFKADLCDPEQVSGRLGMLRDRFGLKREQVNTIDEEQTLSNYLILVDHTISLSRTWECQKAAFNPFSVQAYLGPQLVVLSRQLAALAESVEHVRFVLRSVFKGPGELQTILLKQKETGQRELSIAELLDWIDRFAAEEGPRLINEGGKDGVIVLRPTVETLGNLIEQAVDQFAAHEDQVANPPAAVLTARVQRSLKDLGGHLDDMLNLIKPISRFSPPEIDRVSVVPGETNGETRSVRMLVEGKHFQAGATSSLTLTDDTTISGDSVNVVSESALLVSFKVPKEGLQYLLQNGEVDVENPD